MLPDFPELKKTLLQNAMATVRMLIHQQHPILAEIKARSQHEGRMMRFEQVGFGVKEEEIPKTSFPFSIEFDEVPYLFGQKYFDKLSTIAAAVGEHQMKTLIAKHNEATEMSGNQLDAGGRSMDGSLWLDFVEMMPAEFDEDRQILPTTKVLTHPDMMSTYRAAIDEVENDATLKARYDDINRKQYNAWIDRENRRKLVD